MKVDVPKQQRRLPERRGGNHPGAALALARRGDYRPADWQAELEALIAEIEGAGDNLPPHLQVLHDAMPGDCDFLEYACAMWGLRDTVVAAFMRRDWDAYVFTHHSLLRFSALGKAIEEGLEGEAYWRLLANVYITDDDMDDYRWVRDAYLDYHLADVPPGRRAAMSADELRVFDALPPVVTVYRGATPEQLWGLSWTLERSVAEWFVRRYGGQVYTVQVPKEAILVYYGERNEAEVLIDLEALPEARPEVVLQEV